MQWEFKRVTHFLYRDNKIAFNAVQNVRNIEHIRK